MKIKPEFTEDDVVEMKQLLDAAVRAAGLPAVRGAARLLELLDQASRVAQAEAFAEQNAPKGE